MKLAYAVCVGYKKSYKNLLTRTNCAGISRGALAQRGLSPTRDLFGGT